MAYVKTASTNLFPETQKFQLATAHFIVMFGLKPGNDLKRFKMFLNDSTDNNLLTFLLACLSLPMGTVLVNVLSSFTCKLHKI